MNGPHAMLARRGCGNIAAMNVRVVDRRRAHARLRGAGKDRWRVDLEMTACDAMDTAEVPSGVPDSRGLVLDGDPVRVEGRAATFSQR